MWGRYEFKLTRHDVSTSLMIHSIYDKIQRNHGVREMDCGRKAIQPNFALPSVWNIRDSYTLSADIIPYGTICA